MSSNVFAVMKNWQCVTLSGPDSQDYLQRLSTADFRNFVPGRFTPATLLAATGKIQLYFKALKLENERFLILAPPFEPKTSAAQYAFDALEKMHFRENFTLTPEGDRFSYLRLVVSDPALLEKTGLILLKQVAEAGPGALKRTEGVVFLNEGKWSAAPIQYDLGIVVLEAERSTILRALENAGFNQAPDLNVYRLRAADPAVPSELGPITNPLEARLEDAVHENKGCYPGQEVIERIRAMGQVPRTLVQVRGAGSPPAVPSDVLAGNDVAGQLTSAQVDSIDGGWVGLGFVKRVFAKSGTSYTIAGQEVNVHL